MAATATNLTTVHSDLAAEHRDEDGELLWSFTHEATWPEGQKLYGRLDPTSENLIRANWARHALERFANETLGGRATAGCEPASLVLADLLTNLAHLADALGLSFQEAYERSQRHYNEEVHA
jgi:hypothetical protein